MNFANLPKKYSGYKKSKAIILLVPFDKTASYKKGASKGPDTILKASHELELYDIETDSEPFEEGLCTLDPFVAEKNAKTMAEKVYPKIKKILDDNKFPITLGGEHSISFGAIKAAKERFKDLSLLQLDAHADLWNEFDGDRYSHACVMRRVSELGIPLVQVGIRSMDIEEKYYARKIKSRIFTAQEIFNDIGWIDKVMNSLTKNVYITIDVDVFDPSIMPSTGTPEPGGLLWYQVLGLLRRAFAKKNVIGADIVELAPIKGMHAPDFTIAKLVYKLVAYGKESH